MKKIITFLFLFCVHSLLWSQVPVKPIDSLIDIDEPGWSIIKKWIDSAKNTVEILSVDSVKARDALYQIQISTHNPIGSVTYFTGGILIDHGWLRILGSGNKKLIRTLPSWNNGRIIDTNKNSTGFYLIADDAVGGFFAINNAKPANDNVGKIFYLSPDRLEWEDLDLTYAEFLLFCFSGDLNKFYGQLRWKNWEKDVKKLAADKVYNFVPPLWSSEGKDILQNSRHTITAAEQFDMNMVMRKKLQLGGK